jgi:hydrogenase maturation factor
MPAAAHVAVSCDHEIGCITCGDEAVALRVEAIDGTSGLATCSAPDGATETVEVTLVEPVELGDRVLVHAGVALQRLDPHPEPAA